MDKLTALASNFAQQITYFDIENQELMQDYWNSYIDDLSVMDVDQLLEEERELKSKIEGGDFDPLLQKKIKAVLDQISRSERNSANDTLQYDKKRLSNYEEEVANMNDEEFEKEFTNLEAWFDKINPDDEEKVNLFDKFFNVLKMYLMLGDQDKNFADEPEDWNDEIFKQDIQRRFGHYSIEQLKNILHRALKREDELLIKWLEENPENLSPKVKEDAENALVRKDLKLGQYVTLKKNHHSNEPFVILIEEKWCASGKSEKEAWMNACSVYLS